MDIWRFIAGDYPEAIDAVGIIPDSMLGGVDEVL